MSFASLFGLNVLIYLFVVILFVFIITLLVLLKLINLFW